MMNFAEFFAGVGLVHEALSKSGWKCVWANDICERKQETYVANFGNSVFQLGDVWSYVKSPQLIPDQCFLYTASFPCTDLSLAGARKGLAGEQSGALHAVLKIIEKKKQNSNNPYLIMLENVRGFLTSNEGGDVVFTVKKLNQLGYVVDLIELDAIYFTPQSRPRVFLFAVRSEIAGKVMKLTAGNKISDSWWRCFESNSCLRTKKIKNIIETNQKLKWGILNLPRPPKRMVMLSDIVEMDLDSCSKIWWNKDRKNYLFSQMSALHVELLKKMINKNEYSYGTVYRRTRQGVSFAELRADGIAGCLRTPRGGSSKQILICAGFGQWSVRLLTPREYARLQGVDDRFVLPKNLNQGYFAMGDAVCVPAVKFISDHILTYVYREFVGSRDDYIRSAHATSLATVF